MNSSGVRTRQKYQIFPMLNALTGESRQGPATTHDNNNVDLIEFRLRILYGPKKIDSGFLRAYILMLDGVYTRRLYKHQKI